MANRRGILVLILSIVFLNVLGQQSKDTLQLNLNQAEKQFIEKNLLLLAQQYNIQASRAYILQARLYPNPYFSFSEGAYNPQTKQWFKWGEGGEQAASIQQLIILARKINKQVNIARTNEQIAEYNFLDLLRTLKFTLRSDFFSIYYLQQTEKIYFEEINSLEKISEAFQQQSDKGYIARTEVVRIKAQLYSLRSELNDLRSQIKDKESEMRLVLQTVPSIYVVPTPDSLQLLNENPQKYTLQTLLDSAYQNRTDLLIAKANHVLSEQNYSYQKSLAVPDLTLGVNYDKAGSYVPNSNSVSLGINIPIFNRNQGNIKAQKSLMGLYDIQVQSTEKTVEEQVCRGVEKAVDADNLYKGMDRSFTGEFSTLAKAVYENYRKRNVSLLDFLNFYDSYKQYIVQLNTILQNRTVAMENINYLTGSNFFNQ